MSEYTGEFYSNLEYFGVHNKIKFLKFLNEYDIKILEKHYRRYYEQRKEEEQFDKINFEDFFLTTIVFLLADFKFESTEHNKIYIYIDTIIQLVARMYNVKENDQKNMIEVIKQIKGPYKKEDFDMESFLSQKIDSPYTYSWFFVLHIGYYMTIGLMELEPGIFTYDQLNQLIFLLQSHQETYREYLKFTFLI